MEWLVLLLMILIVLGLSLFLLSIAPRTRGRPSLAVLKGYDYAHRGLHGGDIPENSMAAFQRAAREGFGMEFDLQLTKDGQVVVHHDNSLKRMCGIETLISDLSLAELSKLRLSDSQEGIPLFSEVLCEIDGAVPLIIELKGYGKAAELCQRTWATLKDYRGAYCVESFDPLIVKWFKDHQPQVIRGQLMSNFRGGEAGLNAVTAFVGRNLMTNFVTRPDFEAYNYQGRDRSALRLARSLYGMQEVSWTLRDISSYINCRKDNCICIFEGFDPRQARSKS